MANGQKRARKTASLEQKVLMVAKETAYAGAGETDSGPSRGSWRPRARDFALFSTAIDTCCTDIDLLATPLVGAVQRRDGSMRPLY